LQVSIAWVGKGRRSERFRQETDEFLHRIHPYCPTALEAYPDEHAFLARCAMNSARRTRPLLIVLDSRGKLFSSEEFAAWMGRQRDRGTQQLVFAIGPADGWSAAARERADLLLSFGPMTFPHELARLMLAEQIYRAFTILTGHPYHSGH
jgi:23S rRNA (pseudouridine1915-N3)-methyltransferase